MISKAKMQESIQEIYKLYIQRNVIKAFTLESISSIFEIGNEVFQRHNGEELDRLKNRPQSKAPDIMDDEPFSLERTLEIYERFSEKHTEISPELIQNIFEMNSRLAWKAYRKRYDDYIINIYKDFPSDEYINYLAAIVFYDLHNFDMALHCINISLSFNPSSANYTHIKSLCLMQRGELETARTYLYQSLFLVELRQSVPPRREQNKEMYPNYPIEFHTSSELIRSDLKKIEKTEMVFVNDFMPLFE